LLPHTTTFFVDRESDNENVQEPTWTTWCSAHARACGHGETGLDYFRLVSAPWLTWNGSVNGFSTYPGSAPDRLASGHPHRNASDDTLAILKEESEREGQGASVCIRLGCFIARKPTVAGLHLTWFLHFFSGSILTFKPLRLARGGPLCRWTV
jgi:Tat protein secretion system quality control protein TatD with DNase activity